jgi:hypothetical protein
VNVPRDSLPHAPDWASAMTVGRWVRISGDEPDLGLAPTSVGTRFLRDTDPACDPGLNPARNAKERFRRLLGREWHSPWHGKLGFDAITEAWNGAVFASRHGRSGAMICFGGGHDNYFGSSVHSFDLASRRWQRLTDGYVDGQAHDYGAGAVYPESIYPDGSPLPPHTYNYVQYDPVGNDFILLKGQSELGPNVKAVAIPHLFNLDSRAWRHGPKHPEAILNSGGFTAWDAKRRVLWGHSGDAGGGTAFVAYCPDGVNADGTVGTWREHHSNKLPGHADHNAMQIHPDIDAILVVVPSQDALGVIDPTSPRTPLVPVQSSGDKPRLSEYASLEYSPRLQRIVYFSAVNKADVFAIDLTDEARWSKLTSTNTRDPIDDAIRQSRSRLSVTHTFGRFRVASYRTVDIAILVRHVDSPVYAMRLTE